jgi:hypothetical protein
LLLSAVPSWNSGFDLFVAGDGLGWFKSLRGHNNTDFALFRRFSQLFARRIHLRYAGIAPIRFQISGLRSKLSVELNTLSELLTVLGLSHEAVASKMENLKLLVMSYMGAICPGLSAVFSDWHKPCE